MNIRFNEIRIESIINYWWPSFQELSHEYVANEKEDNYKEPRTSRGGVYGIHLQITETCLAFLLFALSLRCLISAITDISHERDNHGNAL